MHPCSVIRQTRNDGGNGPNAQRYSKDLVKGLHRQIHGETRETSKRGKDIAEATNDNNLRMKYANYQ